jgi:hypothetical protein
VPAPSLSVPKIIYGALSLSLSKPILFFFVLGGKFQEYKCARENGSGVGVKRHDSKKNRLQNNMQGTVSKDVERERNE